MTSPCSVPSILFFPTLSVKMATDPYLHLVEVLSMFDNADKYQPFKVINTTYKSFDEGRSHINADILIPQTILTKQELSKCPVMIRIHGGFLV